MDGEQTMENVAARIAQLQHALDARVVIEQAKGVLAERYELSTAEAYDLIRLAARSDRVKVHALSTSVISSRQTPPSIAAVFARSSGSRPAPARAVENVFRTVNETYLKLSSENVAGFICECADPACAQPISLDAATMRRLHEDRDLYVVKREHVNLDFERIEEERSGLAIVRKPPPLPPV